MHFRNLKQDLRQVGHEALRGYLYVLVAFVEAVANVDLSATNLSNMDVEAEQATIVELVRNSVLLANSLGVETVKGVKPFAKDYLSAVKAAVADAKDLAKSKEYLEAIKVAFNAVVDPIREADTAVIKETLELVAELQLVEEAGLEIYKQAIYSKLDGVLAVIGDVHDYTNEQFAEDLSVFVEIADILYDSKIYTVITERTLPGEECIPQLEEAVKLACELNIVEVKKADLEKVINKLFKGRLEIADVDYSNVDFAADALIYAELVTPAYVVLEQVLAQGLSKELLTDTVVFNALMDALVIGLETSFAEALAPAVVRAVVTKLEGNRNEIISSAAKALDIQNVSDETIMNDLYIVAEAGKLANELGIVSAILHKEDIALTDANLYAELVEKVFEMNMVDDAFANLLVAVVEAVAKSLY